MSNFRTRKPFGTSTKRFDRITCHPGLDPSGIYTIRCKGCDPCLYSPKPIKCQSVKKTKDLWTYKRELEEWSQNLGFRNQRVLATRRWFATLLGPAWHDTPKALGKYNSPCNNLGFGRTQRFPRFKGFTTPAPGTYYSGPDDNTKGKSLMALSDPCRFKDTMKPWSLAPSRYSVLDKDSIENKPKKIVSLRGPYDLFTGKRDMTSIKNHFNDTGRVAASTWPLAFKGSFETYAKSHFGTMNKTNRDKPFRGRQTLVDQSMCIRKESDPGPGHYDIVEKKIFKQYMHGFNSSYDRPPGYKKTVVWPAVGRYSIKYISCGPPGHGHRHVFLSKAQRTIGAVLPEPMNTF